MVKKSMMMVLLILFVMSFVMCIHAQELEELKPINLSWTSGGVGGGWYPQSGGIGQLIKDNEPKITIQVIPGGGVSNPVRVHNGDNELGWGITALDKAAWEGKPPYDQAYQNFRSLGGIFQLSTHVYVVGKELGITTVDEMMDMIKQGEPIRVAGPMPDDSGFVEMIELLAYYGTSFDEIEANGGTVQHAVYADVANLYVDRHVDFGLLTLPNPAASVIQMLNARDSVILSFSDEAIQHLHQTVGLYNVDSGLCAIPAGTYEGQEEDIQVPAKATEFIINKDVSNIVAYTIVKIMAENIEELHEMDFNNKGFTPEEGWKNVVVPLHPGAEMYYKEKGYMK